MPVSHCLSCILDNCTAFCLLLNSCDGEMTADQLEHCEAIKVVSGWLSTVSCPVPYLDTGIVPVSCLVLWQDSSVVRCLDSQPGENGKLSNSNWAMYRKDRWDLEFFYNLGCCALLSKKPLLSMVWATENF